MVSINLPIALLESVFVPFVVVCVVSVKGETVVIDSPVVVSNIFVCPVLSVVSVKRETVVIDSPVVVPDRFVCPVLSVVVSVKRETVVTSSPVVVTDNVVCLELSGMSLEIVEVVKSSKNNYKY